VKRTTEMQVRAWAHVCVSLCVYVSLLTHKALLFGFP